ncbi:MAG: hypothetical protein L0Y45_11915 [Woeseiaceae bacterium]|nr:hypothetical protein [Woeseiaceae bacterium]
MLPATVFGAVRPGDLPDGTRWYLHADLKQMRESASGRELYAWMDDEIFMEIHDEIGIDINKEADRLTAFSGSDNGTVIVLEGNISKESQDKVLAIAAVESTLDTQSHKGKTYYHVRNYQDSRSDGERSHDQEIAFDGLDDEAFFSFAVRNKMIVASSDAGMRALLDNGGKIAGSAAHSGSLFVLTADKTFMQAGLKTDELTDEDDGWQSNIIRNTEHVALMVSESQEYIAIEAQLVSTDPRLTESIGGIVNGLISLQAFNSELDPDIRTLIQNTKIEVAEKVLTIRTVVDPKHIVRQLDN